MKEIEELRGKPVVDLKGMVDSTREELFKMRFASTTEPVDHPNKIKDARRKIARIRTILRQREIEAARTEQQAPAAGVK
jgi:large subunit ribosomal protein L29